MSMDASPGLALDADGFFDMDQFPDDGSDLADAERADLQAALRSDPVEEPTDDVWDALLEVAVGGGASEEVVDDLTGPFALGGGEGDQLEGLAPIDAVIDAPIDLEGDEQEDGHIHDDFETTDADHGDLDALDTADAELEALDDAPAALDGDLDLDLDPDPSDLGAETLHGFDLLDDGRIDDDLDLDGEAPTEVGPDLDDLA